MERRLSRLFCPHFLSDKVGAEPNPSSTTQWIPHGVASVSDCLRTSHWINLAIHLELQEPLSPSPRVPDQPDHHTRNSPDRGDSGLMSRATPEAASTKLTSAFPGSTKKPSGKASQARDFSARMALVCSYVLEKPSISCSFKTTAAGIRPTPLTSLTLRPVFHVHFRSS